MLYELLNAFDPREWVVTAADLLSSLRDKIMPPRLSRRKGQLSEVLEALRPVREKIDELVAVGLGKNIPPTVTKCDAGWIAVYTNGFVIYAKKVDADPQKTHESIWCGWDGGVPIGFDHFWQTTFTSSIFEGRTHRKNTFQEDVEKWLQEVDQKTMRQTREMLQAATRDGRVDLVLKCAAVFVEPKTRLAKKRWLDILEERVTFPPKVTAVLFIAAVFLWLILLVKQFLF